MNIDVGLPLCLCALAGHPNIVSLKDVYESEATGYLFIVRARLRGGSGFTGHSYVWGVAVYEIRGGRS